MLCTRTAGGLSEADYVDMLLDQHASGVVFAGGHYAELAAPHDHYRLLHSRGIPVVLVNAAIDNLDFPCVSTDDVTAAGQSFRHLASLGHERIGLVLGPEDHMPSRRKLAAFLEHVQRAGISVAPVEHALFSLEGGQAATTRMLRQGVTGIICASDVLALGAIRAVRRAGLSVPGDVSVVGFDDSGWLNCTDPPLTTVRQPIESMGKAAVALLVNQMESVSRASRRSCCSSPSWSSAARPARLASVHARRRSARRRCVYRQVSPAAGSETLRCSCTLARCSLMASTAPPESRAPQRLHYRP